MKKNMITTKNIVTIGGGGGHAKVLSGLKHVENIAITGICPSTDSGGSTGILIRDYGCLGYLGDLTKCIAALCPDEKLAAALMHRFESGSLHGHSLKNLLLLGLSQSKDIPAHEALELMHRMCGIAPHRIIPVSMERTELCARLTFGGKISGEVNIDTLARSPLWSPELHGIKSISLQPSVAASDDAIRAIQNADHCIICPGDLYSSIIPVLLPRGMKQALCRSKARITVILNIMTKRGETDGYRAEDFLHAIETRIGRPCDIILYNDVPIPKEALLPYRLERKVRLSPRGLRDDPRLQHISLIGMTPEGHLYHDPIAVRDALEKIFNS